MLWIGRAAPALRRSFGCGSAASVCGDYSVEIVRAGWARSYVFQHKPVQEQAGIDAAQGEAQATGRGIWGLCPAD